MKMPLRRRRTDAVERYLRTLRRWAPRHGRDELVMEARQHLHEATCQAERAGVPHRLAQQMAIRDFGPAWRIGLAERNIALPGLQAVRLPRRLARLLAAPRHLGRHRRARGVQPGGRPERPPIQ